MCRVARRQHCVGTVGRHLGKSSVKIHFSPRFQGNERHLEQRSRFAQILQNLGSGWVVRVPKVSDARRSGKCILEDLQFLGDDVRTENGVAGDVAARRWRSARVQLAARRSLNQQFLG